MRIVHAEPGTNPTKGGGNVDRVGGFAGLIKSNWMLIGAVAIFVMLGMLGPLRGGGDGDKAQNTPQSAPTATPAPMGPVLGLTFDGWCRLPGGGLISPGNTAWIVVGDDVVLHTCVSGNGGEHGTFFALGE